jgi:hypothetical protein
MRRCCAGAGTRRRRHDGGLTRRGPHIEYPACLRPDSRDSRRASGPACLRPGVPQARRASGPTQTRRDVGARPSNQMTCSLEPAITRAITRCSLEPAAIYVVSALQDAR